MRNIAFESSKACKGKLELYFVYYLWLYIILCIVHILFMQGAFFGGCLTLNLQCYLNILVLRWPKFDET